MARTCLLQKVDDETRKRVDTAHTIIFTAVTFTVSLTLELKAKTWASINKI
jgi:hypothetical protein